VVGAGAGVIGSMVVSDGSGVVSMLGWSGSILG
jgi:hypothetical protein